MLNFNLIKNKTLKIKNFGQSSTRSACSCFFLRKNKKAQIAESITWVVATIIIIFLIVSAIYVSSLLGKSKSLSVQGLGNSNENNWVLEKTKFALEINNDNQDTILLWVRNSGGGSGN